MINKEEIKKRFLENTDETGRFIVKSFITGKEYYVEPISNGRSAVWGDINPVTKKIEGNYGNKYTGSISEKESLIIEDNGFKNIVNIGEGVSPYDEIYRRDKEYELEQINSK